jgi:ABC-type branched-subunit amino acid transport system ATPase component
MDVFGKLKEIIANKTAVVIVEQRAHLVTSFADETIVIRDGQIQAKLTPEDAKNEELLRKAYFGLGA